MTSGNKDAGPSSSPAAARKRTAKHSASQDLAGDADKALSPSHTTATTTDTSSSASTPVTPDHPHFNHNHHGHHHGGTPGGVTLEKSSPTKTAPAGNSAGTTGHLRARNTSDHTAISAASVAASSQAQTSTDNSMQQPQGHEQQNDHMQQQQQNTKGNRKRKSRTNSTPASSAATSPSIPTAATHTDEPEEVKPEDYVSPASSAGTKRTRSSTTTTSIAASNVSSSSAADTSSFPSAFPPPPPPPTQSSSTASSPTQPVAKRRRGKSGATSNGNSHESQSSSTPSSRSGSRHGSIDEGSSPTAPASSAMGRASRATKQNAANGQYQEMDEEAGIKSEMSSTHGEQEAAENKNTDQTLIPSQSSQSLPDLGQNGSRKAANTTTTGGKKGKSTKHALSSEANGDHDGSAESEHDHDSSSSSSTPSDRTQHERKEEKQAKNGTQLPKDSQQMKMETDSDASSSVSSSPTLSTALSVSVSSVSMELDAFSLERREMIHKMQAVLPTLPMGSKEREAMYESCMEHLQKLRKEHQRLRQILQMTGTTLDRRYGKGGRKSSPSLSVSSGRSYRSSRQQNGISKDYHERSSSPTVNGSRPSRAGTNKYYGRTR
ncbi:hypothetical protein BGW42_002539 [Actinomortierella wolfii]|nr:hypothetical protein BGW42_002539 [Actinomortierella wolfii]